MLLDKYSQLKGFFTGNGLPNQSVAAKNILKDYVNGVIVYARNPPGLQAAMQCKKVEEPESSNTKKEEEMPEKKIV